MALKPALIRKAYPLDIHDICEVEKSAFTPEMQATKETLLERLKLFPEGFLVLVVDSKIVAFSTALLLDACTLESMDKSDSEVHSKNGKTYYVRSLAVMNGSQSRGHGRMLIEKQLENARVLGKERVVFTCIPEVAGYYDKLGFTRLTDFVPFHGNTEALWEVPAAKLRA